jgi:hypothetical protein
MPNFLAGTALGGGDTTLEEGARPDPAFAFLVAGFFAALTIYFL